MVAYRQPSPIALLRVSQYSCVEEYITAAIQRTTLQEDVKREGHHISMKQLASECITTARDSGFGDANRGNSVVNAASQDDHRALSGHELS